LRALLFHHNVWCYDAMMAGGSPAGEAGLGGSAMAVHDWTRLGDEPEDVARDRRAVATSS